jgi:hypothetical protein
MQQTFTLTVLSFLHLCKLARWGDERFVSPLPVTKLFFAPKTPQHRGRVHCIALENAELTSRGAIWASLAGHDSWLLLVVNELDDDGLRPWLR